VALKGTMALLVVRAKATIEKYNMIGAGSSVLAAVSGGADSVALAHVLSRLTPALDFRLQLAHLNHGIRGDESDADAAFVEEVASGLGASIITEEVDARALAEAERRSLEDACRQARRRQGWAPAIVPAFPPCLAILSPPAGSAQCRSAPPVRRSLALPGSGQARR